jgi:hypothetical protein
VATSEASGVRSLGLIAQTDDIVATDRNMLVAGELDFDPRSALRARILFGEGGANGSSRPSRDSRATALRSTILSSGIEPRLFYLEPSGKRVSS